MVAGNAEDGAVNENDGVSVPSKYIIKAKDEGISGDGVTRIIRGARLLQKLPFVRCSICDERDGFSLVLYCRVSIQLIYAVNVWFVCLILQRNVRC